MHRTIRLLALAPVLALGLLASPASAQKSHPPPDDANPYALMRFPTAVYEAFVEYNAQQAWYFGIEAQRRLDAAAAAAAHGGGGGGGGPSGSTVGECSGFVIPDYIIRRESGGNPNAYNPSGAYGCAQTLLSHYSRGSCQGLDPYTIDGQRACVDRLSNHGTNLAPWAQTR